MKTRGVLKSFVPPSMLLFKKNIWSSLGVLIWNRKITQKSIIYRQVSLKRRTSAVLPYPKRPQSSILTSNAHKWTLFENIPTQSWYSPEFWVGVEALGRCSGSHIWAGGNLAGTEGALHRWETAVQGGDCSTQSKPCRYHKKRRKYRQVLCFFAFCTALTPIC